MATLLLGNILALLARNIPALLGVVNLLTDGLVDGAALVGVHGVAFLGEDGVAFALGNILKQLKLGKLSKSTVKQDKRS